RARTPCVPRCGGTGARRARRPRTAPRGPPRCSAPRAHVVDLAHLEAAGGQMGMVGKIALDLLVARGLDDPEAAQYLLGLREGAVGDGHLVVGAPDHASVGPQLVAMEETPCLAHVVGPRHVLLDHLLHLLRTQLLVGLARAARQYQKLCHESLLSGFSGLSIARTPAGPGPFMSSME